MAQSILNIVSGYWFWAMTGFLFGGALSVRNMVKNGCPFPLAVIAVTTGLYGGLLGAKVIYVLIFYPHLFLDNPISAISFWQGTGTWLGGLLFGAIAIMIVLKAANKPFWSNLGCIVPGLALGHAIGRIGCLFVGCCHGAPTSVPWAIYSEKLNEMVHPTQIYSMIGEIISLAILQGLWRRPERRLYLPAVYGVLLAVHRFISESFRFEDAGPQIILGLRVYQVLCVFIFAFSLVVFMILKWKKSGLIPALVIALITGTLVVFFKPANSPTLNADRDEAGLYLVITRDLFGETLDRWAAERRKNGFDVLIQAWKRAPSTIEIRGWIRHQVDKRDGKCSYILIVGDCGADEEKWDEWHIPSVKHEFQFDQQAHEFVTDALYGDLDQNGSLDVPVGRLAVRSTLQLKTQIHKILAYQYQKPAGRLRVVIWAGAKEYASEIRSIASSLKKRLPKWITPFIIDGESHSNFSRYLFDQPTVFLEQISQSPFITVVVSHGSFRSITPGSYRGNDIFLSVEDVAQITAQNPSGVMFLLGCDSGKYNIPGSLGLSLSEAFAGHPGGPIGVVAATAQTNPLTNYFFANAMIDQLDSRNRTIGDFMLGVQRRLYQRGKRSLAEIANSDRLANLLMKAVPENERKVLFIPEYLRHEALMYNLLGDPTCELKLP